MFSEMCVHTRSRGAFPPEGAFWEQEGGTSLRVTEGCDHARKRSRPPGASWEQEGAFYGQERATRVRRTNRARLPAAVTCHARVAIVTSLCLYAATPLRAGGFNEQYGTFEMRFDFRPDPI